MCRLNLLKLLRHNIKNLFWFLLLSALLSFSCRDKVTSFVLRTLPTKQISVQVVGKSAASVGTEVWISGTTKQDPRNLFEKSEKSGVWEYRDTKVFGSNIGTNIILEIPYSPSISISFWKNINSGIISIDYGKWNTKVDLYSSPDHIGGEYMNYYPFERSRGAMLTNISLYVLFYGFFTVIFFIFLIAICFFYFNPWYVLKQPANTFKVTVFLWIFICIYANVRYSIGIPNFLKYGDQNYYWATGVNIGYSFRGYLCGLLPLVSRHLGAILNIDPVRIYFLFTSLCASLLIGTIIPAYYRLLSDKKPLYIHVFTYFILFSFFWKWCYYYVLMDMFAVTMFLSSIYLILYCLFCGQKPIYCFFSGMLFAASCLLRLNYKISLTMTMISLIIYIINKGNINKFFINKHFLKCIFVSLAVFVIGFCIICIPQAKYNYQHDHFGILPYDELGDLVPGYYLSEVSASAALNYALTYNTTTQFDPQILQMKTRTYGKLEYLHTSQLLTLYASAPFDTMCMVVKKTLLGFDLKTNDVYPTEVKDKEPTPFSTFNYIVIICSLFIPVILRKYKVIWSKREICFALFLIFATILPQMYVVVEWRYFLTGYLAIYYIFSYHVVDILGSKKSREYLLQRGIMVYITLSVFLYQMFSTSYYSR